jgi:putative RecB family exonuclease
MTVDAQRAPAGHVPARLTEPEVATPPDEPTPDVAAAERAWRPSLSPSRAADFKTCPLLYRFRSIDRLPERPTPDQARGTLVHAVLERLFDIPAAERTPERARALIEPEWARLMAERPELAGLFSADRPDAGATGTEPPQAARADPAPTDPAPGYDLLDGALANRDHFLASTEELLAGYFTVEDPRRLSPAEREYLVTTEIDLGAPSADPASSGRLLLRGYIDRLDASADGDLRVVDYKTGGAPREAFEARALFQLKFYALVLWRARGVAPRVLRLLYLKDTEICDYHPEVDELIRFERTLVALWSAIERATAQRDFRPKPSRLCGWCSHQARCPAYGGTPPPFPERAAPLVESEPQPAVGVDG